MNCGIINKEIIEFEVGDKKEAVAFREQISGLASNNIPEIINEVASKYFSEDDLIRIDRIEIDLGVLDPDNLAENFIERFYNKFESEIIRYIPYASTSRVKVNHAASFNSLKNVYFKNNIISDENVYSNEIISSTVKILTDDNNIPTGNIPITSKILSIESNMDLLKYYVNTGSFPESVVNNYQVNLTEVIEHVVKEDRNRLKEILNQCQDKYRTESEIQKITSIESDFELLTCFITTGLLPWWIVNKDIVDLDEILLRVVSESKVKLLIFLYTISSDKIFISRILSQFSASSISALILLLTESHQELKYFYDFSYDLYKTHLNLIISNTYLEQILLEHMLSYLSLSGVGKERIVLIQIEFANRLSELNLLTVSLTKNIIEKIIDSDIFEPGPETRLIKNRLEKLLIGKNFNVSPDLSYMIEEIKEWSASNSQAENIPTKIETNKTIRYTAPEAQKENHQLLPPNEKVKFGKKTFEIEIDVVKTDLEKIKNQVDQIDKKTGRHAIQKHGKTKEAENVFHLNEIIKTQKSKSGNEIDNKRKMQKTEKKALKDHMDNDGIEKKSKAYIKKDQYFQKPKFGSSQPEKIYIDNSGLVLISVFLPVFFKNLDLIENGSFKDREATERGIHLLQFIADGKENTPEYILTLNKILCGLDVTMSISKNFKIKKRERIESIDLLASAIKNWNALKNTSIDGFRESFLIRKGIITIEENHYNLKVERKTYDILLEYLPWNISIIKHSWMNKPVYIEW